jgi:hypothetical protein
MLLLILVPYLSPNNISIHEQSNAKMDALEAQRLRQEVRESIFFDQVGVPEAKRRDLKLCLNTTIPLSTATGLTTFYFLNRHWKGS